MELNIPFADLAAVIRKKTGKDVSFECVDEKTIKAGYDIPVPIIGKKHAGMNLSVDKIIGNDVYLRFGVAASLVISGIIGRLKTQTVVEKTPDNSLIIHLDRIEKAKKTLETISLKDISFSEGGAKVVVGVV